MVPGVHGGLPQVLMVWWHWMARPCAVLTSGPPGNRCCAWSVPGPRGDAWCWDKWPRLLTNYDKSNEITAVPQLLEMLSLTGKVVTPIFDQSGHALPTAVGSAGGGARRRLRPGAERQSGYAPRWAFSIISWPTWRASTRYSRLWEMKMPRLRYCLASCHAISHLPTVP